ncbi:MAG: hypothetical protein HYY63_04755 [Elusimicrobia bacterium]|nr:hypothetical protein [Elusimicrobiota bacterium]
MCALSLKILILVNFLFCFPILWTKGIVGNFGDIYQYAAPFRHFAKTSLQYGIVPLWNPYLFAGMPFLASPQSSLFYSGSELFYFLPLNLAFNLFSVLHLFLNSLGMFLFLRTIGRSRSGSLWGSLFWSYSFFFLTKLTAGHVIHLSGYSWFPWIFLFLHNAFLPSHPDRAFSAVLLSLSLALQFFSGHIQVCFHTLLLIAFYFLWKMSGASWQQRRILFQSAILVCACFVSLTIVQWLPTLHLLLSSTRWQTTELFQARSAFDFASSYSMEWRGLVGLLAPDFFGNPLKKNYADPLHPSLFFETNALYFGYVPVVCAALGFFLLLKRRKYFLPAVILLSLALAMGKNSSLYLLVWKGMGSLRVPARFYFLAFAGLTLTASWFWSAHLKGRPLWKLLILVLTVSDLYLQGKQWVYSEPFFLSLRSSPAIQWLQDHTLPSNRLFTTAEIGNPNKTMFFQMPNGNGYEAILQKSLLRYFFISQGPLALSSTGIDVLNPEKNSFLLTGVQHLISLRPLPISWPLRYATDALKIYENPSPFPTAFSGFSLKHFSSLETLLTHLDSRNFQRNEILTLEKYRAPVPAEEPILTQLVSLQRKNPNTIQMEWTSQTKGSYWIALSESYDPGWKVWSESGRVEKPFPAYGMFQAVLHSQNRIPNEKIFWIYRPWGFLLGSFLSTIFIVFLGIKGFKRIMIHPFLRHSRESGNPVSTI